MLGIEFLKKPTQFNLNIAGLEFMDFQTDEVYRGLVGMLNPLVSKKEFGWFLDWTPSEREEIGEFLLNKTGIKIVIHEGAYTTDNASINAGFFSPNNLMNNDGLDEWYDAKHTNVAAAFKSLKVDVLKGYVDTTTGKVSGDFSKIPFDLWVQEYLNAFLNDEILKKYKVTMAEALASVILHEAGHAFTAFLYAFQNVLDSALPFAAIRLAMKAEGTKQKAEIVKEAFKVLECESQVKEEHLELLEDVQAWRLYFDKALANRNVRRSLSIGMTTRASETYADMYAIRMGVNVKFAAALASMPRSEFTKWLYIGVGTMIGICWMLANPVGIAYGILFASMALVEYTEKLLPGTSYDTPYRRLRGILREMIAQLQGSKNIDPKAKREMLENIKRVIEIVEDKKSFLEGTAAQRCIGWLFCANDFKAADFENYTHDLLSSELAIYTDYFSNKE